MGTDSDRTGGRRPSPGRFGRATATFFCAVLLMAAPGGSITAQERGGSTTADGAVIRGVVRSRFNSRVQLLADALVEGRAGDRVRAVYSDEGGRYVLAGLPEGLALLRVTRVGHEPLDLTVRVPASGVVELDVELAAAPLSLPGVRVETGPGGRGEAPETEDAMPVPDPRFELRRLELSPGVVESGLVEAVMGLPGNDPADPSDVLFMRGSTTDMKLVLLDGVPVYAPFHVGGLLRSFEPSMLASADFHVGGAPARYDGGLTHVLDLRTRTARRDRTRASATVDLLSAAIALEQPLGSRAGLLVSGRALHGAGTSALGGGTSPYGYDDVLATFDADIGPLGEVRVTGFRNRESVILDYAQGSRDARWGNDALTGTWHTRLGSAELQATVGGSRYDALLPLVPAPTQDDPTPIAILASARNERTRVMLESAWRDRRTPIRVGVSFEDQSVTYSADRVDGSSRLGRAGGRSVLGSFIDGSRTVSDGVTIRGGLRADVFGEDAPRLAPRASMAIEIGPASLLTLAAGRYHQLTRLPLDTGVESTLEQFADAGLAEALPVASADHVVMTLAQRPTESVSLGLGGYFKRFSGVQAGGGTLQNSGVDVQVVGTTGRGAAWLGYGLSWFWSDGDAFGSTGDFTGRHLLTMGVSGRLAGPIRVETRFSYGAGLPSTGIPFSGSSDELTAEAPGDGGEQLSGGFAADVPDLLLDESFLRLDVELHTLIEGEWGGHSWRLRPFLRLLNALDRRDALFYSYQPWRSEEVTPLAVRPVLPVFGISIAY